jgi:hypothetical protein
MSSFDDDAIDELFDKLETLQTDDDTVGDDDADVGALERMAMMGGDPSDLPLTYDDAVVDLDDDDRTDIDAMRDSFRETTDDDTDDDDDADDDAAEPRGSTSGQLAAIDAAGPVDIYINPVVVDTVRRTEQPSAGEDDGAVQDYIASMDDALEIHYDDDDTDTVHAAVAETMHPTEEQLREDPDKTITKDSLMWFTYPSAHDDWDHCKTFLLSREGDAKYLHERGPWTNPRFNVQDLIDTLASKPYSHPDGVAVAARVTPFK